MTASRPDARDSSPSVWPTVLALLLSPLAAAFTVSLAVVLVVILSPPRGDAQISEKLSVRCQTWIDTHAGSLSGLLVLVVASQATLLAVAWALSRKSAGGIATRLGFTPSTARPKAIVLAVLGTLGVQLATAIAFDWSGVEPDPHLKEVWRMVSVPGGGTAVLVGVLLSVVPGICEEALFRGVGQKRLLQRWPPFAAIGVASALFAIGHLDVQHSLLVLPLGVWLGFVAWRTGSARAPAACHAAHNLSGLVLGRMWGDPETGSLPATWPFVAAGLVLCACTVLAARALVRARPPPG